MNQPEAQVFLVTGAAGGIGAALARMLVARGQKVVLADVNIAAADQIAGELGAGALAIHLDITSPEDWERGIAATYARFGRFDVLINNAAIVETGYARDVSVSRHQRTMNTNFMGPLTGTLAALEAFRRQGHGHVATVCSMTAFLPFPGLASYAAAKHALRAFHHAVALEERHEPIGFTIVHPTSTETPMLDQEEQDDACGFAFSARPVSPEFVAEVVLDAIETKALEVFMPPERAAAIIALGTDPAKLHETFDEAERAGSKRQQARREARSG
jgi:NAD(P)-dependent dehydrogenase (short-subunit alcohol dehydrogenase family)